MPVEDRDHFESVETKIGINAHLLSPESGYRRAGIHQYIAQVLNHLPLLNDSTNYTVFTRGGNAVESRCGIRIVPSSWPTERRTIRILWEQSAWPVLAAKENIDLLHSMAFVTPVIGQIPTIVTVYDLSFVHFPENFPALQRFYLHSQTARSIKQARRVITISEASRQDLHHFFAVPLEKISVVLPGVGAHFLPLSEEQVAVFQEKHGLSRKFILHVGTLQPRKNILTLLKALARLKGQTVDLVLAGAKGWQYDEIFNQVKSLGLENRVHFTGYVPDEELPFWYNAATALVFPSVYEGFGMPVVEAMACGTPVIAARSSSLPEAGGEAALYFDPQDAETLAQQLADILNDEILADRMRQSGFKQARKFSWKRAGIETSQVYARTLADR